MTIPNGSGPVILDVPGHHFEHSGLLVWAGADDLALHCSAAEYEPVLRAAGALEAAVDEATEAAAREYLYAVVAELLEEHGLFVGRCLDSIGEVRYSRYLGYWTFEIEDSVAVVTSSEKALLSFAAVAELADLLDTARASRDEVSVLVITGTDGTFVPDVDRDELTRRSEGEEVSGDDLAWDRATRALVSLRQPTVAAVDGQAAHGGCLLALACMFRIGSERAAFGPIELNLGILGTDNSSHLVRHVGATTGAELLLTRRELDAPTAKQIGLISEVLPTDGFDAQARRWCQRLAALPPEMVFAVKQAVEGGTFASRDNIVATLPPNSSVPAFR